MLSWVINNILPGRVIFNSCSPVVSFDDAYNNSLQCPSVVRWWQNDPAVISHPKFSYFLHNSVLAALAGAANWRLEDRWECGGDGCAIMRYGYPGLPYTLTPSHKRDTITSVKSEQQKEKKHLEF